MVCLMSPVAQHGRSERLIEILKDVVDVLNPDAKPDHLRHYARAELLIG